MLRRGATKRQVISTDMILSQLPWWPTTPWHTRCSRTTCEEEKTWVYYPFRRAKRWDEEFVNVYISYLTLGESEDPVSTMSTEQPGNSSTREGLRLNTGLSVGEDVRDPRPGTSFFLGVDIGGRKDRLDESSPLRVLEEGEKPSVFQYIRCTRWPWLVSLKWYWHDPWLVVHIYRG